MALADLPDESRIWIFGISPALDEQDQARLLHEVDAFLGGWAAHGQAIRAAREVVEGTFLIVAIDKTSEATGCSIDRMFATLQRVERELGASILDSDRVFFRHGDGRPDVMSRQQFRETADSHTVVFDTTVPTLREVRSGRWERAAAESWHRDLLGPFLNG